MIKLDDIKVLAAATGGLGNWLVEIDLMLKIGISLASLLYIILKCKELVEKNNKKK